MRHRHDGRPRTADGGTVATLLTIGMLLLGLAGGQESHAQTPQSDSQSVRPETVERVRQRIETIRRTTEPWQMREERVPESVGAGRAPSTSPSGLTRADLDRVEARLRQLIRQMMAEQRVTYRGRETYVAWPPSVRPPRPDTVFVPVDSAGGAADPVRVVRDTVYVVRDSVRTVRDTLRETRIETVERTLLDEGVFRAFEVNFAFGTSTLRPRAARTLDAVGTVLERHPDVRVKVAGHTDAVGADSVNQRLSRARAQAVRRYLLDRFTVAPERLVARGYGEDRPVASNDTPSGRALNRRVEFMVLNRDGAP